MERSEIEIRKQVTELLTSENAHVSFLDTATDIPLDKLGEKDSFPYSLWQQIEHTRLAQQDIVEYTLQQNYQPRQWPDDFWPKNPKPANENLYQQSLKEFKFDLQRMIEYINNPGNDLLEIFPGGEGHHALREALLLADHNAYHTGQIVLIRKKLNLWPY